MSDKLDYLSKNLRAWYRFDDAQQPGKDASGNGLDGVAMGTIQPEIQEVYGRKAAVFAGGESGTSYFTLPEKLLDGMNDQDGFSISAWVCGEHASSVWERLFDCGNGPLGPYIFLTRYLRAVCFKNQDLAADAGRLGPDHTWVHIVMNIFGTQGGTVSSAGPRVYINGELESDGFISQTSSGTYKKYREWFASLEDPNNYTKNYIGHSQFDADIHAFFKKLFAAVLVLHVALPVAPFVNIHCKADNVCVPVVAKRSECVFVDEIREPSQSVGTHSAKLIPLAVFVHKLCALD